LIFKLLFMNKVFAIACIAVFFISVEAIQGQTKKLTFNQAWGREASLTKSVSNFEGWADKGHYIERKGNQLFQVHVNTGKSTGFTYPTKVSTEVFVKNND